MLFLSQIIHQKEKTQIHFNKQSPRKKIIIIKIKVLRNNNSASNKLFQEKLSRNNNKINNYINISFKKDQNHSNTINKGLFSKNNKKDSLNEIILNSYTQEKICKKFFI